MVSATAFAQEPASAIPTQDPAAVQQPAPATAPSPAAAPATTADPALANSATQQQVAVSQTTVTSSESMVQMPKKKSCGLINHECNQPHLAIALEGGVSSFEESGPFGFNTSIGSVSSAGAAWGLRVGVELTKWLAIDAHYSGMTDHANGAATPNGGVNLTTSGFTGEIRLTAPIPYVQPYILAGAGVYTTSINGSDSAEAASPLHGSTEFGLPLGVGVQIPIVDGVSVGGEATYHRFFGEEFAHDESIGGGDLTTFNAVLRARL